MNFFRSNLLLLFTSSVQQSLSLLFLGKFLMLSCDSRMFSSDLLELIMELTPRIIVTKSQSKFKSKSKVHCKTFNSKNLDLELLYSAYVLYHILACDSYY